MSARVVVLVAGVAGAVLVACRQSKPAAAPTPVAAGSEPVGAGPAPVADGACVAACRAEYPRAPDVAGHGAYCAARCTEVDAPNEECASGCRASHEPGGYLDDEGEYHRYEDERHDEERYADGERCDHECSGVPVIDDELLAACVEACVADGGGEPNCQSRCDPDPYDECRYQPCD